MGRRIALAALGVALSVALIGCGKGGEKKRATFEFYTEGVRLALQRLKWESLERSERDSYGMQAAVMKVESVLYGLPLTIDRKAETKKEERKKAAEDARTFFLKEMRDTLLTLKYDNEDIRSKLEQLGTILDKVENP